MRTVNFITRKESLNKYSKNKKFKLTSARDSVARRANPKFVLGCLMHDASTGSTNPKTYKYKDFLFISTQLPIPNVNSLQYQYPNKGKTKAISRNLEIMPHQMSLFQ